MSDNLPLVDPEERFVIFWTPRCGSTSLLIWFFNNIGLGNELKKVSAHTLRLQWQKEARFSWEQIDHLCSSDLVKKIVLCRNPLERAVSSYYLLLTEPPSQQWKRITNDQPNLNHDKRLSFREFAEYLETVDLMNTDAHWQLQTSSFWYRQNTQIDYFARVETLDEDLAYLSDLFKFQFSPRRGSVTPRIKMDQTPGCKQLFELNLCDLKRILPLDNKGRLKFPDYRMFYNKQIHMNIQQLYKQDIEKLGYS